MPETSRECAVMLLDETSFTVPVKPTLLANELLDMAASHCKIKEKEYFGLYTDGDGFRNWLELDKPVLDPSQDLPKGTQPIKIIFAFKYFVDDLQCFQDYMTVELLYLQSRQAIMKGEILTDDPTLFELAACAMQVQHGDYKSETEALQQLRVLPVLPASVFKTNSVQYCEAEIMRYYRMMQGLSRGEAIFKYLEIIQSLPMYSLHFFEVKDKRDSMLWLGVGPDGICQCPISDRNESDARYQWLQLQNIYYRDRKFSMEVYQDRKSGKKGMGFGPVTVLAWYANNSKVVMAIWKMARDQHVFYRSRRANKSPTIHGMGQTEIIRQLNKLHRANISPSSSHSSLSIESAKSNQTQASAEAVAAAKAAQNEMYTALLTRRATIVQEFEKKASRYKEILIKEMQITGIPPEGLTAEEIERMRKKFGVSFKFSKFVLNDSATGLGGEVERLERQLEIQSSIIEASKTLLSQTHGRRLKKDRKKDIKQAEEKYQKLEEKIQDMKRSKRGSTSSASSGKFYLDSPPSVNSLQVPGSVPSYRRKTPTPTGSVDDSYLASMIFNTPPSKAHLGGGLQKSPHHKSTSALHDLKSTPFPQQQAPKRTSISATQSLAFRPPYKHSFSSDRSYASDYTESPSYLSTFNEDFDVSPPSSVVSANTSTVSQGQRRSENSLREFDLTEEYLQHFSREQREGFSPTPHPTRTVVKSTSQPQLSPRQPNADSGLRFQFPPTSSPVSGRYKRSSSPNVGPVEPRGGYSSSVPAHPPRFDSSSPDIYLPIPNLEGYSNSSSHHPPGNLGAASSTRPGSHPGHKGALPPNPQWYDNEAMCAFQDYSRQQSASYPSAGPHSIPRRPSEESYDLQEMLKIWAESSQNPFGEGTLV